MGGGGGRGRGTKKQGADGEEEVVPGAADLETSHRGRQGRNGGREGERLAKGVLAGGSAGGLHNEGRRWCLGFHLESALSLSLSVFLSHMSLSLTHTVIVISLTPLTNWAAGKASTQELTSRHGRSGDAMDAHNSWALA